MGIFRGEGGSGETTTDAIASQVSVDSASASSSATEAANSATSAASSASSASASASTASTQATSATNSASAASSSATAAAISRSNASSSETAAGISASSAATAKIAAEAAQTAAETAETNAETAETNAATSATNASNSASAASTSASNASTSASNASTSASNASTSASNAATSATSAQSALTSINAFYLGTASSNPTVDGNGDAVTAGDWYFNTSDNSTRIYNGSGWNSINPDLAGDSSPQLSGDLDLNSNDITGTGNLNITGNISLSGTVDGRDLQTDGNKLDLIEAEADVTDATNVQAAGALMDSEVTNLAQVKAFSSSDYATAAQGSTADSALQNVVEDTTPQLGGNLDLNSNDLTGTGNINITGTLQTSSNAIIGGNLTVSGTTTNVNTETINLADNNIVLNSNHTGAPTQNAGITVERGDETDKVFQWNETTDLWETDDNFKVNGNITVTGTVDGRDVATDGTKLDTVETNADVTDATNVTAAGALMDSEVTNLAQVKAFDSSDYATAAQGSTADSALQNVVEDTTPQLGGNLASNGSDVVFADNDKAIFGAGSDLEIYHDGSNSYITDAGTGDLRIRGANVEIQTGGGNKYFQGASNVASLYHTNNQKLATTSTGIDVTGTVTADGLTLGAEGDQISIPTSNGSINGIITTGDSVYGNAFEFKNGNAIVLVSDTNDSGVSGTDATLIARGSSATKTALFDANGDISFYEDTGATAKLFWDSSAESLGIGTTSPARELEVTGSGNVYVKVTAPTATDSAGLELANTGATWLIQNDDTSNEALTFDRAGTEVMRIDDSGNLIVGTDRTDIGYTDNGGGFTVASSGLVQIARSSANPLMYLNKLDNDGDIISFYKDGAEFGTISLSSSNNLSIGGTVADHSGVLFGTHVVFPTEAGTLANGTISLGTSSYPFKDIVLSGTVDGGNGSAAAPTFTFSSDANTGMFRAAADTLGFSTGGAEDMRLTSGGDLHVDGNVIAYSTTISDRRLKSDITNISNALDKVGQINGVTFVRDHNGEKAAGVVAQEIMEVLPEAVKSQALPLQTGDDESEYYVVEYDAVTGLLVEAVKELKARVEALESK